MRNCGTRQPRVRRLAPLATPATPSTTPAMPAMPATPAMPNWLQYGLQRTGTNWISSLLKTNFGITFKNQMDRTNILHKHTYKVINTTFEEFDKSVMSALGTEQPPSYVVCIKHPYAWYLSFRKWELRCKSPDYNPKGTNPEYMKKYIDFYGKWFAFQKGHPNRVYLFCYEDVLKSIKTELDRFAEHFGIIGHAEYENVNKVSQSAVFTPSNEHFYLNQNWKKQLTNDEKKMLQNVATQVLDYDMTI